ncbi:MAG: hypothetical protein PHO85_03215 [Candidatus Cloacimonetes bacterium]|jgi:hypothetical protein|nr:hypothetical protein [Candidatus Cloacimonadota bacterium]
MIPSGATQRIFVTKCFAAIDVDGPAVVNGLGATGGLVEANNSDRKQRIPAIRYSWANVSVNSIHPSHNGINPDDNGNPYSIKYGGLGGCNETGITYDCFTLGMYMVETAWAAWQAAP